MIEAGLKYYQDHEWVRVVGSQGVIGISDFAQEQLGDVVFVQLPKEGTVLSVGDECGEIESVKSVSVLYAPVSGTITRSNPDLASAPEKVNLDPYGDGWLFELELSEPSELDTLMDAESYKVFIADPSVDQ